MCRRNLSVVDRDTGELVTDGSVSIRHRAQDEAYREVLDKERYRLVNKDRHWVASYHDPVEELSDKLSLTETGAIVKLLPYMRFKSGGKLIKDGKPLCQSDIRRIYRRSDRATVTLLNTLKEHGVISTRKEGRSNIFYISARFHEMGNVREAEMFTKLYQVRTREITDSLALHEAGILYKILPYFHFSEYYLVGNPDEVDTSKLRYIGRNELAERIGMRPHDLTQAVRKLRNKGALMSTESGRTTRYLVHPDLMFRQSTETKWTEAVRKMFEAHRK